MALGVSNQYLKRFQQPYNLDATSEMTVELIDAPIVLNLALKPDVRIDLASLLRLTEAAGSPQAQISLNMCQDSSPHRQKR